MLSLSVCRFYKSKKINSPLLQCRKHTALQEIREGSDARLFTLVFFGLVEAVDGGLCPAGHSTAALGWEVNTDSTNRAELRWRAKGRTLVVESDLLHLTICISK